MIFEKSKWENKRIDEICDLGRGRVISQEEIRRNSGLYPVYSSQSRDNGVLGYLNTYDFEGDYVTWTTDGAHAGTVFFRSGKFNCTNVCGTLKAKSPEINARFLARSLARESKRHVSYVGNPKLMNNVMAAIRLRLPSSAEQMVIADILDTIDDAIAKTEAVIAKLKQIRAGLLHDLLTCGLDKHGQLRDPVAHPAQFKDSPLGRIPWEWEVETLVSRITFPEGQVDPRLSSWCDSILVAPDHIESETGRLLEKQTAVQQGAISGKYVFQSGDVLYSKIRPYLRKATLVAFPGLCSADMYPLRPNAGVNPTFLLAVLLAEPFSRYATSVSMRSGFPKINREEMTGFRMGWPDSDEQERIALVLDIIEMERASVECERGKLLNLKTGLMSDLLTGNVLVSESAEVVL